MAAQYKTKIDDSTASVLRRSEFRDGALLLPQQLPRDLYVKVDKVLKACGGKWNRGRGGHVFAADPREALGVALDSGEIQDQRKLQQKFYTPQSLADEVARLADVRGRDVLEPSAGGGSLVRAVMAAGASAVACVEKHPDDGVSLASMAGVRRCYHEDFLTWDGPKFSRIVMNPPFANDAAYEHVCKAMRHLSTAGGVLVAIVPAAQGLWDRLLEAIPIHGAAASWNDKGEVTFDGGAKIRVATFTLRTGA